MYLVVSDHAVNLVLVQLDDRTQRLVYYVSIALEDVETRYFDIEN